MLFRKKNRERNKLNESPGHDKIAKAIARFILFVQNQFASLMNKKINRLSIKKKQLLLSIFCIVFIGCSIYIFSNAFMTKGEKVPNFLPSQFSINSYNIRQPDHSPKPKVSKTEMLRINRFKAYMDSLSNSVSGTLVYDSIIHSRPGLMDSITIIENIYYSQSK